jgi:hypothetical protein
LAVVAQRPKSDEENCAALGKTATSYRGIVYEIAHYDPFHLKVNRNSVTCDDSGQSVHLV